jgi:2-polyprenyl-6-methoxyphenol hydroxylase-like FAD-dependent oxidoreductase
MLPQEGERWILSAGELHGGTPPSDADGFLAYLQQLRTPTIHDAVRHAQRLGEIRRFRMPASVRRRFERLATFPHGLIAVGDAVCRFSPAYGQGMSVAAQEACALRRLLHRRAAAGGDPLDGLGQALFADIRPIIDGPWFMASLDFAYPRTEGVRPPDFARSIRFMQTLFRLAARDPEVHKLVQEVQDLLQPLDAYHDPVLADRIAALSEDARTG